MTSSGWLATQVDAPRLGTWMRKRSPSSSNARRRTTIVSSVLPSSCGCSAAGGAVALAIFGRRVFTGGRDGSRGTHGKKSFFPGHDDRRHYTSRTPATAVVLPVVAGVAVAGVALRAASRAGAARARSPASQPGRPGSRPGGGGPRDPTGISAAGFHVPASRQAAAGRRPVFQHLALEFGRYLHRLCRHRLRYRHRGSARIGRMSRRLRSCSAGPPPKRR